MATDGLTDSELGPVKTLLLDEKLYRFHCWMCLGTVPVIVVQCMGLLFPLTRIKTQVVVCAGTWMILLVNLAVSLSVALGRPRFFMPMGCSFTVVLRTERLDTIPPEAAVKVQRVDMSGIVAMIVTMIGAAVVGSGVYDWALTP